MELIILACIIAALVIIPFLVKTLSNAALYTKLKPQLDNLKSIENELNKDRELFNKQIADEKEKFNKEIELATSDLNILRDEIDKLSQEKSKGFPFLAHAYDDFFKLKDAFSENFLKRKKHPAFGEAQRIKEVSAEKRKALFENRLLKYQIEYYEYLFPWLSDYKNIEIDDSALKFHDSENDDPNNEESDPASFWIPSVEYNSLSEVDRYQIALERYWKSKKTPWEIGKLYEHFIGYDYEMKGYKVKYHGILEGFDDMGRDLICTKGNECIIVQCKCWKKEMLIHEKHINQLFGTCAKYLIDLNSENISINLFDGFKSNNVIPHFITSATLSDRAKKFADTLGIIYKENVLLPQTPYPCIKCNIAKNTQERIFHLPFDQQYDNVVIERERGEFYAATVSEAIGKKFRRAYRWHGNN